jgi:hypothetical protein
MLKVLGLRKLPENRMKQEYELMLKDLENTKPGYTFETVYGTEAEVRTMLKNGGMSEAQVDICFAQAR